MYRCICVYIYIICIDVHIYITMCILLLIRPSLFFSAAKISVKNTEKA